MGFFSGEKTISVDSVAYNMAGPEENRPHYLKSLVVRNVLSGTKDSIGQTFQNGYLHGPAMKFRSFYRWTQKPGNFDLIGPITGAIATGNAVNSVVVQDAITQLIGSSSWVQRAQTGSADYALWVEQWLLENKPSAIGTNWAADINDAGTLIAITYEDATTDSFVPSGYSSAGHYLYAWYNLVGADSVGPLVTGDTIELGEGDFPSISGWTYEGRTVTGSVTRQVFSRMSYLGAVGDGARYLRETMHLREDIGPPLDRSYRIDGQTYTGLAHGQVKMFIYRLGSGGNSELDAMLPNLTSFGQFFPFIPVRIANQFLSSTYYPGVYAQARKAYKKATGSKFEDYIKKLEDNPNLDDIDYSYIVFGVSLNVLENSCKRYLYAFFEKLQATQIGGPSLYQIWKDSVLMQETVFEEWTIWKNAQNDEDHPLFGTAEPVRSSFPTLPTNEIRFAGTSTTLLTNFDNRLTWSYIANGSGAGLGKPGAKVGELWFEAQLPDLLTINGFGGGSSGLSGSQALDVSRVRLYWQRSAGAYTYLDIVGLTHANYIYGGKATSTTASSALEDTDESSFIVPLHYDTLRELSLVHSSQMATACVFSLFNCYEVKKQKWYETGVFQILAVIVIAILSVAFTGGAGLGLLGAHMAVGATLGFSGITAAIVGSIANAMAALILVTVIQKFSGLLFGEMIGAIIATVFMFAMGQVVSSFHATGSFALNWGDLLKVDNILAITGAVGNGIAGGINAQTGQIGKELRDFTENAKREAEKIQQAFFDEFGYGAGRIDPMMFVDVANSSRILSESSDTFLTRTLMTGGDVAEMSRDLLYNFAEYSNKLPDAFT